MKQWLQNLLAPLRAYRSWTEAFNAIGNKTVVHNLPFLFYCLGLGLLFITIQQQYENRSRKMEDLTIQVKELNWAFKDQKRKLMFLTKESEIATKAQELGLEMNVRPPYRLAIKKSK
jgi:Bacteriodetes cell division protein (FtsL-like)